MERAWTGAPLNTPHRPSTADWPPPCRARVLITLVNALNASAPALFLEQCDTSRAITAQRPLRPVVSRLYPTALLAYVPEPGTLDRRQIAALMGVAPFNRDSGTLSPSPPKR